MDLREFQKLCKDRVAFLQNAIEEKALNNDDTSELDGALKEVRSLMSQFGELSPEAIQPALEDSERRYPQPGERWEMRNGEVVTLKHRGENYNGLHPLACKEREHKGFHTWTKYGKFIGSSFSNHRYDLVRYVGPAEPEADQWDGEGVPPSREAFLKWVSRMGGKVAFDRGCYEFHIEDVRADANNPHNIRCTTVYPGIDVKPCDWWCWRHARWIPYTEPKKPQPGEVWETKKGQVVRVESASQGHLLAGNYVGKSIYCVDQTGRNPLVRRLAHIPLGMWEDNERDMWWAEGVLDDLVRCFPVPTDDTRKSAALFRLNGTPSTDLGCHGRTLVLHVPTLENKRFGPPPERQEK